MLNWLDPQATWRPSKRQPIVQLNEQELVDEFILVRYAGKSDFIVALVAPILLGVATLLTFAPFSRGIVMNIAAACLFVLIFLAPYLLAVCLLRLIRSRAWMAIVIVCLTVIVSAVIVYASLTKTWGFLY